MGQFFLCCPWLSIDREEAGKRWITNTSGDGVAHSWSELNMKIGSLRLIDIDNKVELKGNCFRN